MNPYYADESVTLLHGDCLEVMREMPDASVDAVVTDPPYGLEFMGREWDSFDSKAAAGMSKPGYGDESHQLERPSFLGGINPKCRACKRWQRGANPCVCDHPDFPNERRARTAAFGEWCESWAVEALRMLKPGGHLLAFGGTRTWHRLAVAVEDAGFEVRDSIAWLYGSGFPKSLDVSKAIDKAAGATREVVGVHRRHGGGSPESHSMAGPLGTANELPQTAPATPAAQQWQGWGTALKPAFEPVVVARKPLAGTVAGNVLAHGTGALNVDGCRTTAGQDYRDKCASVVGLDSNRNGSAYGEWTGTREDSASPAGRWPTNVLLDGSQAEELDRQSAPGMHGAGRARTGTEAVVSESYSASGYELPPNRAIHRFGDSGGASRFFPTFRAPCSQAPGGVATNCQALNCPEDGCAVEAGKSIPPGTVALDDLSAPFRYEAKAPTSERPRDGATAHPTVKPLDLMRWLVRLVTPAGGTVLEPFAGSGTTAEACVIEGFRCIAIEREVTYLPLIVARLSKPIQPDLFGGAA